MRFPENLQFQFLMSLSGPCLMVNFVFMSKQRIYPWEKRVHLQGAVSALHWAASSSVMKPPDQPLSKRLMSKWLIWRCVCIVII